VLLYVLLIAIMLIFSDQVLSDLSFSRSSSTILVVVLAVLFPLLLLGSIALNIFRLLRERRRGTAGVGFKLRLLVFFAFIVLLASVPQGILSINFVNAAMNSWFNSKTGDALRGGLSIALQYHDDKVDILETVSSNQVYRTVLRDVSRSPARTWDTLRSLHPELDGFQVFDADGEELFFFGDSSLRVDAPQLRSMREGQVSKNSSGAFSFLRIRTDLDSAGNAVSLVMSIVLPDGFDEKAGRLTRSLEMFTQVERLQTVFLTAVLALYALFSVPLLLLAILVSFYLSDEIIRPLVNLEEATRRVAEGDFSIRILTRSGDQLSLLVDSFNRMVSELENTRRKTIQTEKVAAWQEIAQRLAHEIKNPLTPIKLSAERLLRKHRSDPQRFDDIFESSIRSIIMEVDNLSNLLTEFRNFSRLPEPQLEPVNVRNLVAEVARMYADTSAATVNYEQIDPDLVIHVDPAQMKQVFANLFTNAMAAMDQGGEIFTRADLVKKGDRLYCRIQVQDTGRGISADNQTKVFNPYFTTKNHGTGLGLAIVERIVFDHRGQIWFESEEGIGTTFFIDLIADGRPILDGLWRAQLTDE
jgi:nitrogen fixation/metabolism regulation signal transduction histidine kinase